MSLSLQQTPVSAVLFDYGLVLSGPPDTRAWARMKAILGADEAAFHAAYWRPRHAYDRGDLDARQYWTRVAEELGQPLTDPLHDALVDLDVALWTQPNQPMIAWAAHLQALGMRTGILSNLGDAMERGVLARCGWLSHFAHHTFSHRLGIAKPEPAIYQHAAEGLRTAPEAILFVDDREDNILAAKASGMKAIQYLDHASFVQSMHEAGLASLLAPATEV